MSIFSDSRRRVVIIMATLISRDCDVTFAAAEQHYIVVYAGGLSVGKSIDAFIVSFAAR